MNAQAASRRRLWVLAYVALLACGGGQELAAPADRSSIQATWHELNGACLGPLPSSVRLNDHGLVAEGVAGGVSFGIREVALVDHRGPEHAMTVQYSSMGTATEDEIGARFQASWRGPANSLEQCDGGTVAQRLRHGAAHMATHCHANGEVHIVGFMDPDGDPVIRDRYASRLRPCPCETYSPE